MFRKLLCAAFCAMLLLSAAVPSAAADSGWYCPKCGRWNPGDYNFCPNDRTEKPGGSGAAVRVGSYVTFGSYEQKNKNRKEEIEWIVLDYDAKNQTDNISIVLNDRGISQFNGYQRASNIYLGNFYENGNFVLDIYDYGDDRKAYLYALNMDKLEEVYNEINEGRFTADSVSGGVVTGHVNVTDENRNDLVFTIPYSS